jgi:hypothetical protein
VKVEVDEEEVVKAKVDDDIIDVDLDEDWEDIE